GYLGLAAVWPTVASCPFAEARMECSAASRTEAARTSRLVSATTGISRAASPEMTPGGRFTAVPPTTGLAATLTPGFVFGNAITYVHVVRLAGTAGGLT